MSESHEACGRIPSTGPIQHGLIRVAKGTDVGSPGSSAHDEPISGGSTPRSDHDAGDRQGTAVTLTNARNGLDATGSSIAAMLWNFTNSTIELSTLSFSKQQAEAREKRARAEHGRTSRHFADFSAIKEQQNSQLQSAQTQLKRSIDEYDASMAAHRKIIGDFSGLLNDLNAQAKSVEAGPSDDSASSTEVSVLKARISALEAASHGEKNEQELQTRHNKVESQQDIILGLEKTIVTLQATLEDAQKMAARAVPNQGQILRCQSEHDNISKDVQRLRNRVEKIEDDAKTQGMAK